MTQGTHCMSMTKNSRGISIHNDGGILIKCGSTKSDWKYNTTYDVAEE